MTRLPSRQFDVIIVGGGIIGAGIARDAALRGLETALFERGDYGSGTTSGSTRLVHGGLRYLEMLDFALVRMDLRERETLLRIAPHLVKPLQFVLPFYDGGSLGPLEARAGMLLYDALSFDKTLRSHHHLTAGDLVQVEPGLRKSGLYGAVSYYDAQVNSPERLAIENIVDACARGAAAFNYAEVTAATRGGVRVKDLLAGDEVEVRGRVVVNASGPWFDRVAARLQPHPRPLVRTTKGVHLAHRPVAAHALALTSPLDGRLFFVIPWLGYSWIGTTDTDFREDPAQAHATPADVDYLVRSAAAYLPEVKAADVFWTNAGVRALVMKRGRESAISRRHRVISQPGLISVLGGKITGYRAIAEDVTNAVCRQLRARARCRTADEPLPGARGDVSGHDNLSAVYGSRAAEVRKMVEIEPALGEKLAPGYPDIAAQVLFSVREEQCVCADDFIFRRTLLGFSHDQGAGARGSVERWLAIARGTPGFPQPCGP
jgi:glycerol-3-phosphate dehydrogenase